MLATTTLQQDILLNDVSLQLASSRLSRRLSRGSSVQSYARSARIEKPRSTHNSPRAVDRRRTTTIASKRYTTLEDHWNMMFGDSNEDSSRLQVDNCPPSNRPVSWHVGSGQAPLANQSPADSLYPGRYSQWVDRRYTSHHDNDVASDVEQFPTLDSLQTQFQHFGYSSSNLTPALDSYSTSPSWDNRQSLDYSPHSQPPIQPQQSAWHVPDWVQMTQSTAVSAAPTPSNFFPDQHSAFKAPEADLASEGGDSINSDKILVGMGLYDAPEGYDSWFASGPQTGTGKGLKLEETWEPPEPTEEEEEDDEEDEDEEVDIADDTSMEEATKQPPSSAITSAPRDLNPEPVLPVPSRSPHPHALSGRIFLLDADQSYTNEWWYHQLKRPTAQDAGLGSGWL